MRVKNWRTFQKRFISAHFLRKIKRVGVFLGTKIESALYVGTVFGEINFMSVHMFALSQKVHRTQR